MIIRHIHRTFLRSGALDLIHKTTGRETTLWLCLACVLLVQWGYHCIEAYGAHTPQAKAVIVDQLSLTLPNPVFVKKSKDLLKSAGYDVDYYEGEKVTVDFFRTLPRKGYKLILLRVHSAYIEKYQSLAFFTSEPYSKRRYVFEQLRNRVALAYTQPRRPEDPGCLAITDKFVQFSMEGTFDDTVIIMMGCSGITKRYSANAFLKKGARAYIGWNGIVSARYTDNATLCLLKHLLSEKTSIGDASRNVMLEVGQEPEYKSTLLFWPISAWDYIIGESMPRPVRDALESRVGVQKGRF